jgi:hypothetical protein
VLADKNVALVAFGKTPALFDARRRLNDYGHIMLSALSVGLSAAVAEPVPATWFLL